MYFQKDLVSVDIGSSCIKVMGLKKKQGRYHLATRPYVEHIPRDIVHQGAIEKLDELVDVMRMVVKKSRLFSKTKRCSLSISGNSALVRRIDVEVVPEIPMGEQVKQVAEQSFASFEELHWSFSVLGEVGTANQKSVVICAAKINVIERYVAVMRRLGFKVGVIDSSVLCIANMFAHNYASAPGLSMVVDMGASSSSIISLIEGVFCHSKIITIGGDYYSSCFSSDLGLDTQRAENLKLSISGGGSMPPEVGKILTTVHESLASEINSAVEHYNRSLGLRYGEQQLRGIYLTGGASMIPGVADMLTKKCGVKVHFINPFQGVTNQLSKSDKQNLLKQSPLYGTCLGAGLRRVSEK